MQKTISVKNVEYAVNEKPILQGVSFRCAEDERICIFGENGAGKSTLLKIICGELEPDSGRVEKQGHIRFVFVPQEFDHSHQDLLIEEFIKEKAGETLSKKVHMFAKMLGFHVEKHKDTKCGRLSGGQQKILALSCAFALAPDFLLLDEPENHLDIVSRVELVRLLEEFRGAIIFISHDRLLIDGVATKIGEIVQGKIFISEGDYDDYIQTKVERIAGLQRDHDVRSKRIKQLSSAIVILQQKAFRGKEVSAYKRAKEELAQLKKEAKENGRPDEAQNKIKIASTEQGLHGGKLVLKVVKGMFEFPEPKKRIFDNVDLEIRTGDKVVLLGRNGSGKSTFLKCLTGELPFTKGEATFGNGISYAYFDQHAQFDPELRAVDIVCQKLNMIDQEARSVLGMMKFDTPRMISPIKNLSGGERMRLRFAIVFGQRPDLIILDEPTNHIDEVTWEILLEACKTSKSTILLVSHDYEFIEAFAPTMFWVVHNQTVLPRHKELGELLEEMKG
ncbi:MAG: ABC-F family ATP-binding cassette domain-containing protein [Candidatus Pacebacteria bacterium]|nr:ABC-F family ATP-binding cassette domain-containing protein [Candidatus Paceibacterota bacterium]MBP9780319.1 ABC-F family ATP-binding cassette domain-containing protein [Candidatus Paceibacterota bacterium]